MTHEFDAVRASFASSWPGRVIAAVTRAVQSASRTSTAGAAARSMSMAMQAIPAVSLIRIVAVAIAVAAVIQPVLIAVMPVTVAPAMPRAFFVIVAIFGGLIAWQAEAVHQAWSTSTLARWTRR
jgi:hypothetical protein